MFGLLALLAVLAAPSVPPTTVAVVPARVANVTQDSGNVAWLETTTSKTVASCRLRIRPLAGGATRTFPAADAGSCPEDALALAGGKAAWGGYVDVRCSETTSRVFATATGRGRLVQDIPGDCLGYRTAFQGLTTDGSSFFYSLLDTSPPGSNSLNCGNGGACHWRLAGGHVFRVTGSKAVAVHGLPPAALIAGANGRVALVEPAKSGSSKGQTFDWPRAALNGKVEIRNTKTAKVVTSFSPKGTVRAVALSATRAAVLVEAPAGLRIEWYDAGSGARLGSAAAPRGTKRALSTDGRFVAFSTANTVRVLDLQSGTQRIVRHTAAELTGLTVSAGRLVWAETGAHAGHIFTAPA